VGFKSTAISACPSEGRKLFIVHQMKRGNSLSSFDDAIDPSRSVVDEVVLTKRR
jgi:hypothetical protein